MKWILPLLAVLALSPLLQAQDKAALREISETFGQIEEHYKSWTHYSTIVDDAQSGHSTINNLWVNEGEGETKLIKLEALSFGDHGESKVQFFFKGDRLLFLLNRFETSLIEPEPGSDVKEKRFYFADNKLIRLLEKKAFFPAKKPTDTKDIKNREVPLREIENLDEIYALQHETTAPIIQKLLRLNEDDAPADTATPANSNGFTQTGEGWRVIAGTDSRDGKYALAWGLKGQTEIQGDVDDDGAVSVDSENTKLINYVVNTRTKQIVGPIAGTHFGDKSTYNHSTTETAWSAASMFFAQVNSGKWATYDANVYELREVTDVSVSKGTSFLDRVKKAMYAHLKGGSLFKKFNKDDFTFSLHDVNIAQRGGNTTLVVGVSGMIPKSEKEGSNFEATVAFKVTSDENGGPPILNWVSTESHE